MELKVLWTDNAIEQLENIFDYYKFKAGDNTAKKQVTKIVDRTIQLETLPESGQLEELLSDRKNHFRYIIEGNYKIIYWIEKSVVNIATVFDTRQNPSKMKDVKGE